MILNVLKSIIKNRVGANSLPSYVTYIVTWRCNGRCVFCDVWKKPADEKADEMTTAEAIGALRQVRPIDVLRITGGEPFLRNDIAEIVNAVEETNRPAMIHFTTNGMLTEQILGAVEKMVPIGKIHIKVSIDNIGEKHDRTRGVSGAYLKALDTVKGLAELAKKRGLHVGVNQTIADEDEIGSYFELKAELDKLLVPIYPVIANSATNSLYSGVSIVDPDLSFRPFGRFSNVSLKEFMRILIDHSREIGDFKEQLVDRYHLKGLYNRLVENKKIPKPDCVALGNHLRILPNGDVPVCLYNGNIVGNLKSEKLADIWSGEKIKPFRKWVRSCPGCWQSCETAVSAIYTGDIWKGMFY